VAARELTHENTQHRVLFRASDLWLPAEQLSQEHAPMVTIADTIIERLLAMLPPLELLRVADMPECERLSSASADTLERKYPELIIRISDRRKGMRVAHALMLRWPDTS
jgi:hypothetical protein